MSENDRETSVFPTEWYGLRVRVSSSYYTAERRWRAKLYLYGLDNKLLPAMPKQLSAPVGSEKESLLERVWECLPEIVCSYADLLIQQARSSSNLTLSLDTYVALRKDKIQFLDKWAGQAEEYWRVWEELRSAFGGLSVMQSNNVQMFEELMEPITHRKSRKIGYTEKERGYWVVLGGILRCAADEDKLLEENPLKSIARTCREKLSTIASKNLARQSLTREELAQLLARCVPESQKSDFHSAVIIQVLTGITVPELCGLDCSDWKKGYQISWLEITRAYNQGRYKDPVLTNMLSSGNAYRRVVCTATVEHFLSQQKKLLRERHAYGNSRPLFLGKDKERLTPQEYKAELHKLLNDLIHEGVTLPFVERNSYLKGERRPTIFHGDLLRSTAEYNYRTVCLMNVSEIAAILGVDREHTFAISYVDWGNEQVMMYLREKINRWHSDLIALPGSLEPVGQPPIRRGLIVSGTASPGAVIRIHAPHGIECIIEPDL